MSDDEPESLLVRGDATRLPFSDKSFSLVFGSPPYLSARLYLEDGKDLGIARGLDAWIEWMLAVTTEALRVSRGAVVWVAAGSTKDRNYLPACEGLMYLWHKRGGHAYRPCYWHRVGIPGSGGDQWFRSDIEHVMCFKRPGPLPWSDNTACGTPPKFKPGGALSYRTSDDTRVGTKKIISGERRIGGETQSYITPDISNPGNLITTPLLLADLVDIIEYYEQSTKADPREVLRGLREALDQEAVGLWFRGIYAAFLGQKVLLSGLQRGREPQAAAGSALSGVRQASGADGVPGRGRGELRGDGGPPVLRPRLPREDARPGGGSASRGTAPPGEEDREEEETQGVVFGVRDGDAARSSPQGQGRDEQRPGKPGSALHEVPQGEAQERARLSGLWRAGDGARALQQALPEVQEVWRSFGQAVESPHPAADRPGLIRTLVGGGHLGNDLAHLNSAPFPEALAEHFVRSLCPPGGITLDPFSGSGTTCAVAARTGRTGVGVDLRMSQCLLGRRRIAAGLRPASRLDGAKAPAPLPGQQSLFA